jgi:hypothetical protein
MPIAIQISFLRTLNVLRLMQASVKKENGQTVLVPLFLGQESVVGEVRIDPVPGKKVEHTGLKIELLGQIELYFDRGSFYDFTSLGELQHLQLQKHLDCGTGMSVWFHSSADTFRIDV